MLPQGFSSSHCEPATGRTRFRPLETCVLVAEHSPETHLKFPRCPYLKKVSDVCTI
jgi:hypothetical protein